MESEPHEVPREGIPVGRGVFLGAVAAGLAGIGLVPFIRAPVEGAIGDAASVLPSAVRSLAPIGGWRIYSVASPMPTFDPATYELRIGGLVQHPQTLRWSDVSALPRARQTTTFHCVTGWTVDNVHWEGVRGTTLIDLVKPLPSARYVTLQSMEEPYTDQITVQQLALPDVMLAHTMNGKPLSRAHGSPMRLIIPEMYGYKNVKWVRELRFVSKLAPGYWEQRGYDIDAWVGHSNGL
jgi:DMSO/TMAO reductase YedYZ molybdopterin-dependent catalytic subunit